jgi:tRNA pseudouridine32 synthase/23S rRNA pseudouridine746 synthase
LGPARLRVRGGPLGEELTARFGPEVAAKASAGEVVDPHGVVLDAATVLPAGASVYLYRDLPDEVPVPFDVAVLYQDDAIVVIDKPHFLATMPRRAPRRADRAGTPSPATWIARAEPSPPAGSVDRRGAVVHHPP